MHHQLEAFTTDIQPHLSPDNRIAAYIGWHYSVFLDRPVYSLFFAKARAGGTAGVEALIDKYSIDTILMADFNPNDQDLAPYFTKHYRIDQRLPTGILVRARH